VQAAGAVVIAQYECERCAEFARFPFIPRPDDRVRDDTPDEAGDLAWPACVLFTRSSLFRLDRRATGRLLFSPVGARTSRETCEVKRSPGIAAAAEAQWRA
jgi:hypothetical protein